MRTERPLWPTILGGWALAAIVLTLALAGEIAKLHFPDPDDAMRLLEVRDWLSGQSWWDVGQHRLNGGAFAMHWSRLVDLPLAAVMLLFDPLVGTAASNRIAMCIVPLLTLLALLAGVAALTRKLSDPEHAQFAVLLAPLSIPIVYQIRPMRIDHHGWQIVLAVVAVLVLVGRATPRRGVVLGTVLATLVTISLEGLPIAVLIVGVATIAWMMAPERRGFTTALGASLFFTALILHVATRGPGMLAPACDAISPIWLALLGIGAASLTIAGLVGGQSLVPRLGVLAVGGCACLVTLARYAPECTRGPFATLDPLVYNFWYEKVSEGLPVWQQEPGWAVMTIAFPIVGLIGSVGALRKATGPARARWAIMLGVLGGAFAISLMVMRAGGTANALALPGGAWALLAMLRHARLIRSAALRVVATAGAIVLASPGIAVGAVVTLLHGHAQHDAGREDRVYRPSCTELDDIRGVNILPPGRIFAPIDVTPDMIATTDHTGISGGYHRNAGAMHRVIATFTGSPEHARREIAASGARYVALCPGLEETEIYTSVAPNGFSARLVRGERFPWLTPVPIAGSHALAWKVIDTSHAPLSSAPARP